MFFSEQPSAFSAFFPAAFFRARFTAEVLRHLHENGIFPDADDLIPRDPRCIPASKDSEELFGHIDRADLPALRIDLVVADVADAASSAGIDDILLPKIRRIDEHISLRLC